MKLKIKAFLLVISYFSSFILAFNELGIPKWLCFLPALIFLWIIIDFAIENR